MYGEKPWTRPPSAAPGSHTFHLRKTTNAAVAEMGMASTMRTFVATSGLNASVKGAPINPRSGLAVFCAKFTPVGTNMALVKNGFSPWAIA